jgi:hypothetical protein
MYISFWNAIWVNYTYAHEMSDTKIARVYDYICYWEMYKSLGQKKKYVCLLSLAEKK